jgi:acylphosphatase
MTRDVSAEPTRRRVRVRIEGRVQGVGFRAFVQREALARGVDGYVHNRRDGGVEAVFDVCRKGPRGSRVDMMKVFDEHDDVPNGFATHATV